MVVHAFALINDVAKVLEPIIWKVTNMCLFFIRPSEKVQHELYWVYEN